MQNPMMVFILTVFDRKYSFRANFVQKNQNCQFKLKFCTTPNWNMQNSMVIFILLLLLLLLWLFETRNTLQGKLGLENCQFKPKFGLSTNSNMKNSVVMFTLSFFGRKYPFFGRFVPKNQNCLLKLKFRTPTNPNM